jgi:hypothetical protein
MLEAGRRRWQIQLYRPSYAYDGANQPVASFTAPPEGPLSAEKLDVSDGERVQAQQVGADLTSRFRVLRSSLTAAVAATWQIGLLADGAEVARYSVVGKKDLLAHGEFGRLVGYELTALARIDGPPPPES